jgi:hypothetical protein
MRRQHPNCLRNSVSTHIGMCVYVYLNVISALPFACVLDRLVFPMVVANEERKYETKTWG